MTDREKIIKRIESQIAVCKEIDSDWISLTVGQGRKILELLQPEPIEPIRGEGMDTSSACWWYVCPSCRIAIDYQDRFCRHCGQPMKWE